MRVLGILIAAIAMLLSGSGLLNAQAPVKIPVEFECQCADDTGRLYQTAFLDLLATGPRYTRSSTKEKNFRISVVSTDPSPDKNGKVTVLSVVFLWNDNIFLYHIAQVAGSSRVKEAAEATLAALDAGVQVAADGKKVGLHPAGRKEK